MKLSRDDQHSLLTIAEWSIQDYITRGKRNTLPEKATINDNIRVKAGVFVSVYIKDKLRGCIGTFDESTPLYENVQQMAIDAATRDGRFKPVKESELNLLHVEISVLSPRVKIERPEEIEIGKHGIYMIHGYRRATLLPQVAVKYHWSPIQFLEKCAENKLGLHKDSWKESELFVYEAIVFS